MTAYLNLGEDSVIRSYSYGSDYIRIEFSDNSIYAYTKSSAGTYHIQNMIRLAQSGHGLNSYILMNVRMGYAQRSR